MNILFVNYGDFTTNSLNHIGPFANELTAQGHACVVAIPERPETISVVPSSRFIPALFSEVLARPNFFPDARPADLIHAWTPREGVRRFVLTYLAALPARAKLIIHLEDNEEHLIATYTGRSIQQLETLPADDLDALVIDALPHPLRYRDFLSLADGVTVIVPQLKDFVPQGIPCHLLQPGLDFNFHRPRPANKDLRKELGVATTTKLVVFTGSNTFANQAEMRELYVAVALLNHQGVDIKLVRTGFNHPQFLAGLTAELKANVIDLGFVEKAKLPELLALADLLVQPGAPGPFNDYRLPSKVPEFLASGRPLILPRSNVGLQLSDGANAIHLNSSAPSEIADQVRRLLANPDMAEAIGAAGHRFALQHFELGRAVRGLAAFYGQLAVRHNHNIAALLRLTLADLRKLGSHFVPAVEARIKVLELTETHAKNLEALLEGERTERAHQKELSAQHATNLETLLARERADKAHHLELAGQHIRNLESVIQALRADNELRISLTATHIRNLEERLVSDRTHWEQQVRSAQEHAKALETLSQRSVAEIEAVYKSRIEKLETLTQVLQTNLAGAELKAALANKRTNDTELASRQKLDAIHVHLGELKQALTQREDKIKRMQDSFSWSITSPLRALRRWFIDSPSKSHAKATAAAPVPPPVIPAAGAPVAPPVIGEVNRVPPPLPTSSIARSYTYNLDHPRSWNTTSNRLLILGWCFENTGAPIKGLRARLGDQTYEGIYGSKRLDVLASVGGKPQAEYCGVKIDVKTVLGDHTLSIDVLHEDGWSTYFTTTVHVGKPGDSLELSEYEKWCADHEKVTPEDQTAIDAHIASLKIKPLISIIVPVYNPPEELFVKTLDSVVKQYYTNWELCIADDASTQPYVREIIERYAAKDSRIRVIFREKNGHISAATNSGLSLATGEWVALFDHDDILHATALYEVACEINAHPGAQFIYTDEDKIDGEDRRFDPYFKPDWNPDLLHGQNFTSHLSIFRRSVIEKVGGFRLGFEGSQDWDLTLRVVEAIPAGAIRHIPKVLYHWRAIPGSTALQISEKSYPVDAARRALIEHFERLQIAAELLPVPGDHWRIRYLLPEPPPFVSLIIPTRNAVKLVRQAINSIREKTTYSSYEILLIDNGSDDPESLQYFASLSELAEPAVRVIRYDAPFNYSAINNFAVTHARGSVIGLVNNDIEVISPGWLEEMVSHAVRPGIGAVGAMLYYPMNTVQHAGVVLGLGGVAGHCFKEFTRGDQGQKNRMRLVQNYSAVTGACLLLLKERFLEVGGLNEKELAIAFNDVDLCCKLLKAGYRNLWTPHAELYHHESATRGIEDTPEKKARFQSEVDYMMTTWGELLGNDPAYNPNLTLVGEDFSTAYLPRTSRRWLTRPDSV